MFDSLRQWFQNFWQKDKLTMEEKYRGLLNVYEGLLKQEVNRSLSLDDLRLRTMSEKEIKSATPYMRLAFWEIFELMRLVGDFEKGEREVIVKVRDAFMKYSKTENNILPHEENAKLPKMKSHIEQKDLSPLLPRHDIF